MPSWRSTRLPSSPLPRHWQRGFTLLETVLAFAVLGMVLSGLYTVSARSAGRLADARNTYLASEFARSMLDQYILATPPPSSSGTYRQTWDWEITEQRLGGLQPSSLDKHFAFYEVSVVVTRHGLSDTRPAVLSRTVARKAGRQ
ncbi:type II secretion system protein [Leisingera sp. ANG-M7]|uniref:type II secretion system protein n=1 Tax=Leisingera sp. ANG-M7 TaxID=1577902 RepID=UPI0009E01FB1